MNNDMMLAALLNRCQMPYRYADIARRVKEARQAQGLSQKEMGEKLNLTETGYGHYERGRQEFSLEQMFRVSRILNRSVEYFLGLETGRSAEEDQVITLYRQLAAAGMGRFAVRTLAAAVEGLDDLKG